MPRHPFHIVDPRPWPVIIAVNVFSLATGLVSWFHEKEMFLLFYRILNLFLVRFLWWRDVVRERTYMGRHTSYVSRGLRAGMLLFIFSEALFFFGFFWAFFHRSFRPTPEVGCVWPPVGVEVINPFAIPLLNTGVLLRSGFRVTWSHHSLIEGDRMGAIWGLVFTIMLGGFFTVLQAKEYYDASFSISDGVYGSVFFVTTGFHGLHVIIGTIFLRINLFRVVKFHYSNKHHLGFEFRAWYWHFVDVVWIFLYLFVYYWGS
jgi:cytochrome c oxidase subunit 3